MQTTIDGREIIVRGSPEHKEYLWHQHGFIRGCVNWFEEALAISGRTMLLVFVAYITVKASIQAALHIDMPWQLDAFMLTLQVLGLEGSVAGLIHLSEELEEQGKHKSARMVCNAAYTAQVMVVFTGIDIVLQLTHTIPMTTINIDGFTEIFSDFLFVARIVAIGLYLIAMARLEHKGPKIISREEAAKMDLRDAMKVENGTLKQEREALLQEREALLQRLSEAEKKSASPVAEAPAPTASWSTASSAPTTASPRKEQKQKQPKKTASPAAPSTGPLPSNVTPLPEGKATREEVKRELERDPDLLVLSERKLAERLNASASTVRRAMEEYRAEHAAQSAI